MDNNYLQIDRYLQGDMSSEEQLAFEHQMANDKALQQAFHLQAQISKAATAAGLKNEFARAIKQRTLIKQLWRWGLLAVVLAAAVLVYLERDYLFHTYHVESSSKASTNGLPAAELFNINTAQDTIIETREGLVLAIPAHAFKSDKDDIQLQIKTALNPLSILQNGLSTMSNDRLLQTAGMFSVNGFDGDQPLQLNKEIAVSIPAKEINPAMQLFDGVESSNGTINWVNPQPIDNRLRTYNISQLDFYPPKYIPTLKELQKDYRNKKYTDSLYYSFSGYSHSEDMRVVSPVPGEDESVVDTPVNRKAIDSRWHPYIWQIDPAKIKALWDPRFNNTIIATKEFEERLRYIHTICNDEYTSDNYLEAYLRNLAKPLYETDELIARSSLGETRKKFLEFAKRKDGGVMVTNALQQKLSTYFYQRSKAYREAAEKTWAQYQDSLAALNEIANKKRRDAALADFERNNKNFQEEYCTNLTNAYQQVGIHKTCHNTVVPPAEKYYNITISTPGWKNLDMYVMDATKNRQSMSFTDSITGKTATITYSEMNITIEQRVQYDRVLVYLMPDSLSSFQRVQETGGRFTEKLNGLFRYDALVLAYKGNDMFYFKQSSIQPTNYVFRLAPITMAGLQKELGKYDLPKATDMIKEVDYLLFDQKELKREAQLRDDEKFRITIARAIYGCAAPTKKAISR